MATDQQYYLIHKAHRMKHQIMIAGIYDLWVMIFST